MAISRRQMLRMGTGTTELRPPWLKAPATFTDHCTRCNHCIEQCPENIIQGGLGGYPRIDFSDGECTFCGACTQHCEPVLFHDPGQENRLPWALRAEIGAHCLAYRGVMCRICEDACEPTAIRFTPAIGGTSQPMIDSELCSGCGACIRRCPEQAIEIKESEC